MKASRKLWWLWLIGGSYVVPALLLWLISLAKGWRFPDLFPPLTLQHWTALTSASMLGEGLLHSLLLSTTVAIAATMLGFLFSRTIAFHPYRDRWLLLSYLPYVLAPVVLAALLYLFFLRFGWTGTLGGVWLGQFYLAFPYAIILFTSHWNERLRDFQQLATTLGASKRQSYFFVIWPLSKQILLVGLFQTFLIAWFEFGLTSYLGMNKIMTLPVLVYQYIQEANPHLAAVAALLLMIPPALVLWVNKRFLFTTLR